MLTSRREATAEYIAYVVTIEALLKEMTLWRHRHEDAHSGMPSDCRHPKCRDVWQLMHALEKSNAN